MRSVKLKPQTQFIGERKMAIEYNKEEAEEKIVSMTETIETSEKSKDECEKDYERVKAILNNGGNKKHNRGYILKNLREHPNTRKIFLSIIKSNPARISEVSEFSLLTKPTCYTQLHKLLDFSLISRIFVMDIKQKKVEDKEIEEKFDEWTKAMPENLKRYYLAKTSFWRVTEFGKKFIDKAFQFEQEFKEEEENE